MLPLGSEGDSIDDDALVGRVEAVERAYAERGLPARFQVTASSWPPGLPGALARRSYAEHDPTLVMTARVGGAARVPAASGWRVVHRAEPSPAWLSAWWAVDGRGGAAEAEIAGAILARIEPPCAFVECHDEDGLASVGLGVLDGTWVGVFCMATLPAARRRGRANAVLSHLLQWAAGRGARRAHLAVTAANAPAQGLYRAFGFSACQAYRYLTLPGASSGPTARGPAPPGAATGTRR